MNKIDEEYAEKMAMENCEKTSLGAYKGGEYYINGYMKAIEECNVDGLINLLKKVHFFIDESEARGAQPILDEIKEELKKAGVE